MAKIVLININSYRKDINNLNDVVGIFDDNHKFSDREKELFNIVEKEGTKQKIEEEMKSKIPEIIYEEKDRKEYWKDGEDYKEIKIKPKYLTTYDVILKEFTDRIKDYSENFETIKAE